MTPVDLVGVMPFAAVVCEENSDRILVVAARDEAQRANRAKDEFTGRMSHELRTPLNAILGFAQLLERAELSPEHSEWAGHVLTAGRLLLSLVNEVLEFEQVAAGKLQLSLEPVLVSELLDEVLAMVGAFAEGQQITVINDVPSDSEVAVRADRRRLGQILTNLLTNAVKYNKPGGQVRISVATEADADLVRLSVADTGPGIAVDQQARLFMPFERLGAESTAVEGTGLGLALTKALTEAPGGRIGVQSIQGHGSTFWVELPAALHFKTTPAATAPVNPEGAPGRPKTVLYIEDNPVNVRLMEMLLNERPDVTLLTSATGDRALDLAVDSHPAMILLDLHLPDLDGAVVLTRLRADTRTADIPVIVVSADAYPTDIARLRNLGADGYLSKPFDVDPLLAVIDRQ